MKTSIFLRGVARALSLLFLPALVAAQPIVLHDGRARLGDPDAPEWEWFEQDRAQRPNLELKFQAQANATEATLFIRQADVKLDWRVTLNGKVLGKLSPMEADLVHWLPVPAGARRAGENSLSISTLPANQDDIVLREIVLDPRPVATAIGHATLRVKVRDEQDAAVPARITIVNAEGTLVPLVALPGETLAVRSGVAYTGNGRAGLGLQPGRYTVYASRGFEFSAPSKEVQVQPGETAELDLQIKREVPTQGWVAADTHIHTLSLSGHGDATLDERMLTIAGEGIEFAVATEHNKHADYAEAAQRMGVAQFFTTVRGNEVTTARGHFNIFPVDPGAPVPDAKLTAWPDILRAIRQVPGVRVVQLNHPRGLHSQFRPFDPVNFNAQTGENPAGLAFDFEMIESLNSGAQQTDYMLVYRDWFALLNRGHRIVAGGSSDSHDVSRFIVGQARTYIQAPAGKPGAIDIAAACESLRAGRAIVSMGLLPQITVQDRFGVGDLAQGLFEEVSVAVKVLGPSWVNADKVELFANGELIKEVKVPSERAAAGGVKAEFAWKIPRPNRDAHLVVIASGPEVTAPFWAMSRPYQPSSPKWTGRSIGVTNPVWLDGDGDGKFTAIRQGPAEPGDR